MGVNAGRVETQNAGQVLDVFLLLVKTPRKQMPQVVREHLLRRDLCRLAQRLHHAPNVGAVQRSPAAGHKDRPLADAPRPAIDKQPRTQRPRQKQQAAFALVADLRPPLARRAHGSLIQQITQLQYKNIDPKGCLFATEQIRLALDKLQPSQCKNKELEALFKQIVSKVLMDKNGAIQLKLKNGQIL